MLVAILVASMFSTVGGVAYAIMVQSNTVNVNPINPTSIALVVNNTTPYVGNPIIITATLGNAANGVIITFKNGNATIYTVLGTVTTVGGGIATLQCVINNTTPLKIYATTTF